MVAGALRTIRAMASLGRGITNKQASYLAALCRELGEPYPGSGMSRLEASVAINDRQQLLRARSRRRPRSTRAQARPADG
jgi:hypothetical protein